MRDNVHHWVVRKSLYYSLNRDKKAHLNSSKNRDKKTVFIVQRMGMKNELRRIMGLTCDCQRIHPLYKGNLYCLPMMGLSLLSLFKEKIILLFNRNKILLGHYKKKLKGKIEFSFILFNFNLFNLNFLKIY